MTAVSHEQGPSAPSRTDRGPVHLRDEALAVPRVPQDLVTLYRPRAKDLSRRIAESICREIDAFSAPPLHALVHEAISAAVDLFIDVLAGAPAQGHEVAVHYRWLGNVKGAAGHNLDAMNAAHNVAIRETRDEVRRVGAEFGFTDDEINAMSTAVMDYQGELHQQSIAGWVTGRGQRGSQKDARARLLGAMLESEPRERLDQLATPWWSIPATVAVATTALTDATKSTISTVAGSPCVLAGIYHNKLVVVTAEEFIEQAAATLATRSSLPVAFSWGVAPDQVRHGLRWAERALRLARQGIIAVPHSRVVRCLDHRADLMRHADPMLNRTVALDVLAPLLQEKPHQRSELWETLLLWLQTHGSAPSLARDLGVHEQTARNRLRRLKVMFGDALTDPESSAEILQALQTVRDPGSMNGRGTR